MNPGMNQMMGGRGQGMPQQPNMPQQQAMPQQPVMAAQQQMAPQQQQNMTHQQKYMAASSALINSVQERNPYMKEQVGHLIFDYVQIIVGSEKAPKITGMLIELPIP
jgi:hypothetical protein